MVIQVPTSVATADVHAKIPTTDTLSGNKKRTRVKSRSYEASVEIAGQVEDVNRTLNVISITACSD